MTVERVCAEPGCETRITHQSKTGFCRPHAISRLHADPAYQARRLAGMARKNAEPGFKERRSAAMNAGREHMSPEKLARRSAWGKELVRRYLSDPEVIARAQSPDARARAAAKCSETAMSWCPPELRAEYHWLIRSKRYSAAEARAMIEKKIPGTQAYAQREVENRGYAMRIVDERRRAQEY